MIIPTVGSTCLYTFLAKFSSLDGVYKTKAETTFMDAIASGVDFVTNLYTPAGLAQSDFDSDYAGYTSDRVLVLESVSNNDLILHVPESALLNVPDSTIREYFPLLMVVNLGAHKNSQDILPLINNVKDLIQSNLGIEDPVSVMTNTQNKIYLTEDQYQTLETAREANINRLAPLSVQLRQALADNTILATKIAYYEGLIAQLGS